MTRNRWWFAKAAFLGAMFALAFAVCCQTMRRALPFPAIPQVTTKLEHLAQHGAECDTLFIGSSRIYYQIIPALFDRIAAERGHTVKSFNAGIAGMRPPEDSCLLELILQKPPPHLRWVFVELSALRTNVGDGKRNTMRAVYWHDWPRLKLLFQRALVVKHDGKRRGWKERLGIRLEPFGDFWEHVELFFQNQTSLGRGALLCGALLDPDEAPVPPKSNTLGADLAGWVPTGNPEAMLPGEAAKYEKAYRELREEGRERDLGDPISQQALRTMVEKIEANGARAVLVIPPTTSRRNFYPEPNLAAKAPVLDFSDPEKFPELFEPRHRLDKVHLNVPGSEIFTRALAEAWAELARARR
jgi:hypothetical protein